MKKAFLLLAVMLTTAIAAHAQVSIGVRAGANYAGFDGTSANENYDRIWGFHGGLTANFAVVEDFFSIQPEVLYSMKGGELKTDVDKWKVNYIDIPVLGKINAGPLYFEAGPQLSIRAGGEVTGPVANPNKDIMKRTSFGYAAGIGVAATAIGASIGVRFNGDISKLYDKDITYGNFRNSVFMLTLGFAFPGSR
ncbi:porin family protein [Botryobacter ruber]|uniref:porin family protein n=1 Tax=Botryobacter ruber TaxID=2171629 RepID=UPI000E09E2E4|nr:porin family protein [Botryobacter ruber]